MSSSYIRFREHGFWCPDSLLEILSHLLGTELQAAGSRSMGAYGTELVEKSQAGLVGCFDLELDSLTENELAQLKNAMESVLRRITERPATLSAAEMNELGLGSGSFSSDLRVEHLSAVVWMLGDLLEGRWVHDASDDEALPSNWLQ